MQRLRYRHLSAAIAVSFLAASPASAETLYIAAGRLIDGVSNAVRTGQCITVEAERIKAVGACGKAPDGAIGVKLSTPRRGCSGLAYSVDYISEAAKFDEKIETPGGIFYIDGASVLYLIGSTMDWVEDDFSAGFVFNNPNAKGMCGCGESFTV